MPVDVANIPTLRTRTEGRSASIVQIESSKLLPALLIIGVLSAFGSAMAILAWSKAGSAETEARMLEYYVLEMDAKLLAAGFKTSKESIAEKRQGERP